MLKELSIKKLFGKKDIELKMDGNVLIITGNNGNGKTTILNILYIILVGDINELFKFDFEDIEVIFDENYRIVDKISVTFDKKSTPKNMSIHYNLRNKENILLQFTNTNPYDESGIRLIYMEHGSKQMESDINEAIAYFGENDHLSDIADELGIFDFWDVLQEIRNSILYFPTYRRVDIDMEAYLGYSVRDPYFSIHSQQFSQGMEVERLKDRRVVGISNDDIIKNLEIYTQEINEFISENLDELLKNFVKKFIEIIMKKGDKINLFSPRGKRDIFDTLTNLNSALELNIDEKALANFSNEYQDKNNESLKIIEIIKDKNPTLQDVDMEDEEIRALLFRLMDLQDTGTIYLSVLEDLYIKYQDKLTNKLRNYKYISDNISRFSSGKLKLERKKNNEFVINKNDNQITFEKLSTGEKQLFTFFVYCALHLPSNMPCLVIIDEPELSLHPKWQNTLLNSLTEKENISILTATHSPYVINKELKSSVVKLIEEV